MGARSRHGPDPHRGDAARRCGRRASRSISAAVDRAGASRRALHARGRRLSHRRSGALRQCGGDRRPARFHHAADPQFLRILQSGAGDLYGHALHVSRAGGRRRSAHPAARVGGQRSARYRDRGSDLAQAQGARFHHRPAPPAPGAVAPHERDRGLVRRGGRRSAPSCFAPRRFSPALRRASALCRRFYQLTSTRVSRKVPRPGNAAARAKLGGDNRAIAQSPARGTMHGEPSVEVLLKLSRAIDHVNDRFGEIANWLVLFACLISAGNAASRYLFSASSNAWLEVQWYMFAGMVLLGGPYTLKVNEHVRVDLIYSAVSERTRIWIDIIGCLLFLLPICVILTYFTWPWFVDSWRIDETSSNAGGLIRWPVKLLLPVGFALMALQGVSELIKRIEALIHHHRLQYEYENPLQ